MKTVISFRRTNVSRKKVAIIGAGIAGITLARNLADFANVTVFEKGSQLGGRMAHRKNESFAFDHGAQYFTSRSDAFKKLIMDADAAVDMWPTSIADLPASDGKINSHADRRYVGRPTMRSLVERLAKDIAVSDGIEIKTLERAKSGWNLIDESSAPVGTFDLVISTAPAPQTYGLMPEHFGYREHLKLARMSACFTLMIGTNETGLTKFEAARVDHPVLSWIAIDSTKPGRAHETSVVAHSRNDWADAHLEAAPDWVQTAMLAAFSDVTGEDLSSAECVDLHRWRFANVEKTVGMPFLFDRENSLAACGDWCVGNRVEAAFESAWRLAQAIRDSFAEN
jgi:predicted NAD/FAD-dependent oxidoreductase